MRIRKRFHSLTTLDLPSPPPPMAAAAPAPAVAVAVGGAAGRKEGEALAAAGEVHGYGGGSGGGEGAGGRGRGLHPSGDLPAQGLPGCTTRPAFTLPFPSRPPEAATPEGEEGRDLPPPGTRFLTRNVPFYRAHGWEVPKGEQDGENGGDGDADHLGVTAAAPKGVVAKVSELSLRQDGYKTIPTGVPAASTKAEDMAKWSDEEKGFPPKKRSGRYHARATRSVGEDEEDDEQKMAAEREMKPRPINTRRRRTAASTAPAMATTVTAPASAGSAGGVGAPTAAAAGTAAKKCDDEVVKEGGGDVTSAVVLAPVVDGNRSVGNGKKRRSPAVLMEGSRCSRVNGRGWRCCQQTLVGYSLCEHHLGKGRLRSVSSVRFNGRARKKEEVDGVAPSQLPSPVQQKPQQQLLLPGDGDQDEEGENPGKRRRKKIGTVKARSISSLLHQSEYHSTPTAMAAPEPSPFPCPAPATVPIAPAAAPLHGSDSVVA